MPANPSLIPSTNYGWSAGFRNMLRKENARWWNRKSLLVQFVIWLAIVNALVAFVVFVVPHVTDEGLKQQIAHELTRHGIVNGPINFDFTVGQVAGMGLSMFFQLSALAMFIGAVIIAHDSILKERETGTAAWLLSKPLSRKAFVLAKVLANGIGMMSIVLIAQGIIAYAMCSVELGSPVAVFPFLAGLGLLGLDILFYLVLATVLGAFSLSRGVTLGVPIVFGLIGGEILTVLPDLGHYMPWTLSGFAQGVVTGASISSIDLMPVIATALLILLLIGAAVWRFEKIEL